MTDQKERKVIVDRSKWRIGGDAWSRFEMYGKTLLLNGKGLKCCLGFAAEQLGGFSEEKLRGVGHPKSLCRTIDGLTFYRKAMTGEILSTPLTDDLIRINDDYLIDNMTRETKIRERGLEGGIEFEFVGEYPGAVTEP
jgi:hypothetical protein